MEFMTGHEFHSIPAPMLSLARRRYCSCWRSMRLHPWRAMQAQQSVLQGLHNSKALVAEAAAEMGVSQETVGQPRSHV